MSNETKTEAMTAGRLDEIRARAEARCAGQVPSVSALILAQEDVPALLAALESAQAGQAKAEKERDAIRGRVVDLFEAGFRTRGAKAMTASDALRSLVGLEAGGAAWKMGAGHPEVWAREEAERKLAEAMARVVELEGRLSKLGDRLYHLASWGTACPVCHAGAWDRHAADCSLSEASKLARLAAAPPEQASTLQDPKP